MNDLLLIASGAGLKDGLNPCIFMACSVFIVIGLWLQKRSFPCFWMRSLFVLAYAGSFMAFNFGITQIFVLNKYFLYSAKILYFVSGIWTFILGVLFFNDWISIRRGVPLNIAPDQGKKVSFLFSLAVGLVTVILALILGAMATLWPIDPYVYILGNASIMRGQWLTIIPFIIVYVFICMWAMWVVWAFLSIKNLRLSLMKIFCAAIFLTASSCMILMFK